MRLSHFSLFGNGKWGVGGRGGRGKQQECVLCYTQKVQTTVLQKLMQRSGVNDATASDIVRRISVGGSVDSVQKFVLMKVQLDQPFYDTGAVTKVSIYGNNKQPQCPFRKPSFIMCDRSDCQRHRVLYNLEEITVFNHLRT